MRRRRRRQTRTNEAQWRAGINRQLQPDAASHQLAASRAAAVKRTATALNSAEKAAAERRRADRRNESKRARRAEAKQAEAAADVAAQVAAVQGRSCYSNDCLRDGDSAWWREALGPQHKRSGALSSLATEKERATYASALCSCNMRVCRCPIGCVLDTHGLPVEPQRFAMSEEC